MPIFYHLLVLLYYLWFKQHVNFTCTMIPCTKYFVVNVVLDQYYVFRLNNTLRYVLADSCSQSRTTVPFLYKQWGNHDHHLASFSMAHNHWKKIYTNPKIMSSESC